VYQLKILALTDSGVRCSTGEGDGFWLPRKDDHVKWHSEPTAGKQVSVTIPKWLASKHKQLDGDDKRDYAKPLAPAPDDEKGLRIAVTPGGAQKSNARDMSGVLFRNQRKNTDNQPDYFGDAIIRGEKFRLAGWLREGKGGKFLRLAVSDEKPA
jgi:hypothetical protein